MSTIQLADLLSISLYRPLSLALSLCLSHPPPSGPLSFSLHTFTPTDTLTRTLPLSD